MAHKGMGWPLIAPTMRQETICPRAHSSHEPGVTSTLLAMQLDLTRALWNEWMFDLHVKC